MHILIYIYICINSWNFIGVRWKNCFLERSIRMLHRGIRMGNGAFGYYIQQVCSGYPDAAKRHPDGVFWYSDGVYRHPDTTFNQYAVSIRMLKICIRMRYSGIRICLESFGCVALRAQAAKVAERETVRTHLYEYIYIFQDILDHKHC